MKTSLIILLTFTVIYVASSQNKDQALNLAKEAITYMNKGEFQKSIDLLEQAKLVDTANYNTFQYEIAFAYYLEKDYSKSIQEIIKVTNKKDSSFEAYQLLGNAQDLLGEADNALKTYKIGMGKFPGIGNFYLESGNIEYLRKNYNEAIEYWEKGIKVDPNYPSNYYRLAKLFSQTEELIWSLFYSEIFINLEPNSKRTDEISNLMYSVYQRTYTSESDTSGQFNWTKKGFEITIKSEDDIQQAEAGLLPFEGSVATIFSSSAFSFLTQINYETIYEARRDFILNWFDNETVATYYKNSLLEYQAKMIEKGHFEAYSKWLLSGAKPELFGEWFDRNVERFKDFSVYFEQNSLELNKLDFYSRRDY